MIASDKVTRCQADRPWPPRGVSTPLPIIGLPLSLSLFFFPSSHLSFPSSFPVCLSLPFPLSFSYFLFPSLFPSSCLFPSVSVISSHSLLFHLSFNFSLSLSLFLFFANSPSLYPPACFRHSLSPSFSLSLSFSQPPQTLPLTLANFNGWKRKQPVWYCDHNLAFTWLLDNPNRIKPDFELYFPPCCNAWFLQQRFECAMDSSHKHCFSHTNNSDGQLWFCGGFIGYCHFIDLMIRLGMKSSKVDMKNGLIKSWLWYSSDWVFWVERWEDCCSVCVSALSTD